MEKKTKTSFTQQLHTLSERISEARVIIGAVIVVFGTVASVFLGAVNYAINIKNQPIINRVEAVEARDKSIEETLGELKQSDSNINTKLDALLFKLIPNYDGGK